MSIENARWYTYTEIERRAHASPERLAQTGMNSFMLLNSAHREVKRQHEAGADKNMMADTLCYYADRSISSNWARDENLFSGFVNDAARLRTEAATIYRQAGDPLKALYALEAIYPALLFEITSQPSGENQEFHEEVFLHASAELITAHKCWAGTAEWYDNEAVQQLVDGNIFDYALQTPSAISESSRIGEMMLNIDGSDKPALHAARLYAPHFTKTLEQQD